MGDAQMSNSGNVLFKACTNVIGCAKLLSVLEAGFQEEVFSTIIECSSSRKCHWSIVQGIWEVKWQVYSSFIWKHKKRTTIWRFMRL
jgi:hypothetical protein